MATMPLTLIRFPDRFPPWSASLDTTRSWFSFLFASVSAALVIVCGVVPAARDTEKGNKYSNQPKMLMTWDMGSMGCIMGEGSRVKLPPPHLQCSPTRVNTNSMHASKITWFFSVHQQAEQFRSHQRSPSIASSFRPGGAAAARRRRLVLVLWAFRAAGPDVALYAPVSAAAAAVASKNECTSRSLPLGETTRFSYHASLSVEDMTVFQYDSLLALTAKANGKLASQTGISFECPRTHYLLHRGTSCLGLSIQQQCNANRG